LIAQNQTPSRPWRESGRKTRGASVTTVEKLPTGQPPEGEPKQQSFRDWARESFGIWSGPLSSKQAMVQVLLPFAAAALGMTIFGVLLHFAAAGA
jgi:hypothetical protein